MTGTPDPAGGSGPAGRTQPVARMIHGPLPCKPMEASPPRGPPLRNWPRIAALLALWLASVACMVTDYVADPYDAGRTGTRAYFHNHEGALAQGLGASAIELAVLLLILRPWCYRRSWRRAVLALTVFVPWTALCALSLMHAGGVFVFHAIWLTCVVLVLAACAVWSGAAALRARPPAATAPPPAP